MVAYTIGFQGEQPKVETNKTLDLLVQFPKQISISYPGETMNTFEIFVCIVLALIVLYILWHGYVIIVAYRWRAQDKLISRALAPRDELP